MKNLKKDEVYVVVDTPKKAKKLKNLLDMFFESHTGSAIGSDYYDGVKLFNDTWCAIRTKREIKDETEVSIKELRNILAKEHLKQWDVCLFEDKGYKVLGRYKQYSNVFKDFVCDKIEGNSNTTTGFHNFIRYATEEEKALLEPKKELEVGKWYKYPDISNWMVCVNEFNNSFIRGYGFNSKSGWMSDGKWMFFEDNLHLLVESTTQEVERALIEEAKRRYKVGDVVNQLDITNVGNFPYAREGSNFKIRDINEPLLQLEGEKTFFYLGNLLVLKNGVWADVIKQSEVEPKPSLNIGDVVKLNNSQVAVVRDSKEAFRWRFCTKLSKEEVVELLFGKEEGVELIAGDWYEITNSKNTLLQYNPNGSAKGWWNGTYGTWAFSKGGGIDEFAIPASDEILTKFGVKV